MEAQGEMSCSGYVACSFLCILLLINFFPHLKRPPRGLSSRLALSWASVYTGGTWWRRSSHFGFSGFPNRNRLFHFNISSGEICWTLHFGIRCKVLGSRNQTRRAQQCLLLKWASRHAEPAGVLLDSPGLCIDRSQAKIPGPKNLEFYITSAYL